MIRLHIALANLRDRLHRPAIYVDADGATVVRDRWGTAVVGGGA